MMKVFLRVGICFNSCEQYLIAHSVRKLIMYMESKVRRRGFFYVVVVSLQNLSTMARREIFSINNASKFVF